jgi:tetratricopeptide (TPR) repeat protein
VKTFAVILLILVSLTCSALADASADFDGGNKLYAQGNFAKAATIYEQIVQSGCASPELWFNLGNAHFKTGHFGQAIAAYRHAERLAPRDPDVKANLQFARNRVAGNDSVRPNLWQRALGKLTLNEWTWLAVVALWAWFILLALREWKTELRPRLGQLAVVAGLSTFLLGGCAGGDWFANHSAGIAVVIVKDAAAKTGPLDDSQNAFTPKDGTELTVLDQRDDWLQVCDSHRRIGWLKRDVVQVF